MFILWRFYINVYIFGPLLEKSRQTLGPTHPSIQKVHAVFSSGVKRPGREADDDSPPPHLVRRLRISGAILIFPVFAFIACKSTCTFAFTYLYLYHNFSLFSWIYLNNYFQAHSQNCQKRLLTSSYKSVWMEKLRSYRTDFHVIWYSRILPKIWSENPNFFKIWQEHRHFKWRRL
jgi:hypothetical protein